ncbi:MAG: agmatine deiminase family protein [Pseudomonadota bacterium]
MPRDWSRRNVLKYGSLAVGIGTLTKTSSGIAQKSSVADYDGFYVPDEAEPHERTFMQWPVSRTVYRDPVFLDMVQETIADIANAISEFEPVVLLMDKDHAVRARKLLSDSIEIWDVPTDDLWCRDGGPLFTIDSEGGLAVSHLNFNGWGNKQPHANDGKVAKRVAEILETPVFDNGLVGEPGGVESNGHGTLIAHESSWVNPNRNVASRDEIGNKLLEAYGAEKIVWAPGVYGEDITDYHIDALCRFVAPDTILIQLPERVYEDDPWSAGALETYEILRNSTDAEGRPFNFVIIPDAQNPRIKSLDFVASYVNYYVCNGAVISAAFGDSKTDAAAREALVAAYPDRQVVTLNVDPIGEVGGGIHCATQQQPKTQP